MIKCKTTIMIIGLLFVNSSLMALDVTPAMRGRAEQAIRTCEASYQKTKQLSSRFDQVKRPGMFSLPSTRKAYNELALNKAAYQNQMGYFAKFTNEKINIRRAATSKELQDKIVAYSSNCSRFAAGISGFVVWATSGYPPTATAVLFKEWQNEARPKMKK